MMRLYVINFETKKAYVIVNPSLRFLREHDNGHLVSIGLSIGEDIPESTVKRWVSRGFAKPTSYQDAIHGGCQSSCVKRGDDCCRW